MTTEGYLSKFIVHSLKWRGGWFFSLIPRKWNLEETDWKIFDHGFDKCFLVKDDFKIEIEYDVEEGKAEFFFREKDSYQQIGSFEIDVIGRIRKRSNITSTDNKEYQLGLSFSPLESNSDENEMSLEEMLKLVTKMKKVLKKILGK